MNKIVSLTVFLVLLHLCWRPCGFWYDTCKECLPHKLAQQCAVLSPPQPRFLVGGVKMYLKSAISRTFCQGYTKMGWGGPMLLLLLSKIVVPVAGSFSMVVETGWCFFSPVEWPGKAELTRARWLRSSRLDPQSALHCYRSCLTFPATRTGHSCSYSQCLTDPGSKNPHNCFRS